MFLIPINGLFVSLELAYTVDTKLEFFISVTVDNVLSSETGLKDIESPKALYHSARKKDACQIFFLYSDF